MDINEAKQVLHDFRYGYDDTTMDELMCALELVKKNLPYKPEAYTMEDVFKWACE